MQAKYFLAIQRRSANTKQLAATTSRRCWRISLSRKIHSQGKMPDRIVRAICRNRPLLGPPRRPMVDGRPRFALVPGPSPAQDPRRRRVDPISPHCPGRFLLLLAKAVLRAASDCGSHVATQIPCSTAIQVQEVLSDAVQAIRQLGVPWLAKLLCGKVSELGGCSFKNLTVFRAQTTVGEVDRTDSWVKSLPTVTATASQ